MVKINYDEHGDPQSVDMSYEEYCELLKNTQSEIKVQILGQISEFIHAMQSEAKSVDDLSISAASPQEVDEVHPESDSDQPIQKDIRYYNNAKGYYLEDNKFCVMKGSKARGCASNSFNKSKGYKKIRDGLIDDKILVVDDSENYTFTQDKVFNSPSAAACIVDGNSRSGRVWVLPD